MDGLKHSLEKAIHELRDTPSTTRPNTHSARTSEFVPGPASVQAQTPARRTVVPASNSIEKCFEFSAFCFSTLYPAKAGSSTGCRAASIGKTGGGESSRPRQVSSPQKLRYAPRKLLLRQIGALAMLRNRKDRFVNQDPFPKSCRFSDQLWFPRKCQP